MPNIVQRAIDRLAYAFNTPMFIDKQRAAEEMYSRPQIGLQRRSWAARCSETLNLNGLIYRCQCDTEYPFPSVLEAMKDHVCPGCKEKFVDPLKFVGINPAETPVNQWEGIFLAKLPHRPFSADRPKYRGPLPVGDWGNNESHFDEDNWDGVKDKSRSKAFESGDPAMMGPGF